MQIGKRRLLREHAINQALLIWVSEDMDILEFHRTGTYTKIRQNKMVLSKKQVEDMAAMAEEAKRHGGVIQVKPRPIAEQVDALYPSRGEQSPTAKPQ